MYDMYDMIYICIIDMYLTYSMRFFLHNSDKCINYQGVNLIKDM